MRVGFVGLGRMGKPMALNLLRAGFAVTVHSRSRGPVEEVAAQGATAAGSPAEVAAACDVVLTCLPTVETSEQVFLGEGGLVSAARRGQVLVDHSTIGPSLARRIAAAARARGAAFLDAPISGGTERAADGTLTIMAGGDADAFARALPVFQALGRHVHHVGPAGAGCVVKLANQLLVAVHTVAACEAVVLGTRGGADARVLLEVLGTSWGASTMLQRHGPLFLSRDFGSRAPIRLLAKDLRLIEELEREWGVALPTARQARAVLEEAERRGMGEMDSASLLLLLEERAGLLRHG